MMVEVFGREGEPEFFFAGTWIFTSSYWYFKFVGYFWLFSFRNLVNIEAYVVDRLFCCLESEKGSRLWDETARTDMIISSMILEQFDDAGASEFPESRSSIMRYHQSVKLKDGQLKALSRNLPGVLMNTNKNWTSSLILMERMALLIENCRRFCCCWLKSDALHQEMWILKRSRSRDYASSEPPFQRELQLLICSFGSHIQIRRSTLWVRDWAVYTL